MSTLRRNRWISKHVKLVLVAAVAVRLAVSYGFVSLAIDQGGLWEYAVALVFLLWALRGFWQLVKMIVRGQNHHSNESKI